MSNFSQVDRPNSGQAVVLETPRRNRDISINVREGMAIEFFAAHTRIVITGQGANNGLFLRWVDYVMASSIDEPAVRYAVAATGCVHQSTVSQSDPQQDGLSIVSL